MSFSKFFGCMSSKISQISGDRYVNLWCCRFMKMSIVVIQSRPKLSRIFLFILSVKKTTFDGDKLQFFKIPSQLPDIMHNMENKVSNTFVWNYLSCLFLWKCWTSLFTKSFKEQLNFLKKWVEGRSNWNWNLKLVKLYAYMQWNQVWWMPRVCDQILMLYFQRLIRVVK